MDMEHFQDEIEDEIEEDQHESRGQSRDEEGGGGYEDTFDELNRRVASNSHSNQNSVSSSHPNNNNNNNNHTDHAEEELDALEYSQDEDGDGDYEQHQRELRQQPQQQEEEDDEEEETDDDDDDDYAEEHDPDQEQEHPLSSRAQQKEKATSRGGGGRQDTKQPSEQKQHLYENQFTKPVLQVGKTTVSVGEARLFGLMDKQGNVKVPDRAAGQTGTGRSKAESKEAIAALSRQKKDPKDLAPPEAEDEDQKECRFKPQRSKEASRAMRNPSCGYDFVTRLEERGDFMARNGDTSAPKGAQDPHSESAKEDYEASLDKLQCPSCRKYQSFDEFVEKRRSCGQCRERYQRLNVVNMNSWKRRQQQAERLKQERLRKIEEDHYANVSFAPKLNKSKKESKQPSLTERTALLMERQKADAQEARAEKERQRAQYEQQQKEQAAAARANRAAAARREQEEGGREGRGQGRTPAARASSSSHQQKQQHKQPPPYSSGLNQTAPASGLPHTGRTPSNSALKKKKHPSSSSSFNKTTNNISAKFDMLLN